MISVNNHRDLDEYREPSYDHIEPLEGHGPLSIQNENEPEAGAGPNVGDDVAMEEAWHPPHGNECWEVENDLFHERMLVSEAKMVFVSADRKESHYVVPLSTVRNYHYRARDFVVVGFRYLRNHEGRDVLVGWCNAERDCPEASYRRVMFPESDMDLSHDILSGEFDPLCPCAKQLYGDGSGPGPSHAEFNFGFQSENPEVFGWAGKPGPKIIKTWKVARHEYSIVNLNEPYDLIFNQWGVSKINGDGTLVCKMCLSTPRHCAHNKALSLLMAGESGHPRDFQASKDAAEASITRMLDDSKSKFKLPCISRLPLPFFPEQDQVVATNVKGILNSHFVSLFFFFCCTMPSV